MRVGTGGTVFVNEAGLKALQENARRKAEEAKAKENHG